MLVLAIVALLVPLGISLRSRVDAEVRAQARSEAELVAARASALISPPQSKELETLARLAGRKVRGRVLIVASDGSLVADSAGGAAADRGNYRTRPEIAGALRGAVVQERRNSKTLNAEILATAVPVLTARGVRGAVRVTQSVAAVNRAVKRTWLALGLIGALVLALGLVAGSVIARRISRPILELDEAARQVADGDLSARARVEGSLEQQTLARTFNGMTERVSVLLASQREFVADASHQLRTPLTGLRLQLEEARALATVPAQQQDLDAGLREVDRLAGIVTELLELSRAGEGNRPAATCDPADATRRAGERFAAAAGAVGCTLTVDPGAGARVVACHAADLDRILDVLVENAIAYAPGQPVEITASGGIIRVRDHGNGLDEGEAQAVFDRFHRGRAGRAGPPGTGLGLSIARELARRWGGDLTLTNTDDRGAVAQITMPVASAR